MNYLKHIFGKDRSSEKETEKQTVATGTDREQQVYDTERLTRQKLYEHWVAKDEWLLKSEGIYLLAGFDPDNTSSMPAAVSELWDHACDCVEKRLLPVANSHSSEQEWRVKPSDLYCWATVSRVSVPLELSELMEFVLQTIKVASVNSQQYATAGTDNEQNYLRHREIVMGASFALIADQPQQFCTKRGKLSSRLIAAEIESNAAYWFRDEAPLLARSAMEDLIESYLDKKISEC